MVRFGIAGGAVEKKYWWQGPQSPFSPRAAQGQGVSAAVTANGNCCRGGGDSAGAAFSPPRAHSRPTQVVGCSGYGCGGGAVAQSSSSSSSGTSSALYWQQPNHPCATHQGPDCPAQFTCVNFRSCSNGFLAPSSGYSSYTPTRQEVRLLQWRTLTPL